MKSKIEWSYWIELFNIVSEKSLRAMKEESNRLGLTDWRLLFEENDEIVPEPRSEPT